MARKIQTLDREATFTRSSSPSIVITGPARSGTTFLIALFRALGYGIGFRVDRALDRKYTASGGLEYLKDKATRGAAKKGQFPEVVKETYATGLHTLDAKPPTFHRWAVEYGWELDTVICTRRDLVPHTESQIDLILRLNRKHAYTEADRADLRETLLSEYPAIVEHMEATVRTYPHVFIDFPRNVTDWRYCYDTLKPILDPRISSLDFQRAHVIMADPSLVHHT